MSKIFQIIKERGAEGLLQYIENNEDLFVKDENDASLLHAAAYIGDINGCEILALNGLTRDSKDKYGNTPFNYAMLGLAIKRKNNNEISREEKCAYWQTLRFLYLEEEQEISAEAFLGPEVFDYV